MGVDMTIKELLENIQGCIDKSPVLDENSPISYAFMCDQALNKIEILINQYKEEINGTNS